MARFIRTRRARQDLVDIWRYVAADDPAAADRLLDALDDKCGLLAQHPHLGPARDDIRQGLRYLVHGDYLILYRIVGPDVEIVRVVHARRDVSGI
jgi:toxin ParE1/3/4